MKTNLMNRITSSVLLLRFALVAMGAFILFICILISPVLLDAEAGAFKLFVLGLYIASVPYHFALYQAWLLLNHIENNQAFTIQSVQSLKRIKLCALLIAGLFVSYSPYILTLAHMDDAPGLFAGGLLIIFLSMVIGIFSALLEKLFQNAVDIKKENDLTV